MSMDSVTAGWARPVLHQMGLNQVPELSGILSSLRVELESSQFLERIRSAVTQMNHQAGRQIIEALEFLPPTRLVTRLRHVRGTTDYCLEIMVRPQGPKAVFYTITRHPHGLWRIFNNGVNKKISSACSLYFRPEAVREADVQSWIKYLLSEFKSEFQPVIGGYRTTESVPGRINTAAALLDPL